MEFFLCVHEWVLFVIGGMLQSVFLGGRYGDGDKKRQNNEMGSQPLICHHGDDVLGNVGANSVVLEISDIPSSGGTPIRKRENFLMMVAHEGMFFGTGRKVVR